jgi:hypothetical protein
MTYGKKSWLFISFLSLVFMGAFGQLSASKEVKKPKFPRWVSEKGYWIVESNINFPTNHIIRFYNADNVLVYKETLAGVKLDPERTKIKMKLKRVLESSVVTWEKMKKSNEEMALVKSVL